MADLDATSVIMDARVEKCKRLCRVIKRFPPLYNPLVRSTHTEEASWEQVAKEMHPSIGSAKACENYWRILKMTYFYYKNNPPAERSKSCNIKLDAELIEAMRFFDPFISLPAGDSPAEPDYLELERRERFRNRIIISRKRTHDGQHIEHSNSGGPSAPIYEVRNATDAPTPALDPAPSPGLTPALASDPASSDAVPPRPIEPSGSGFAGKKEFIEHFIKGAIAELSTMDRRQLLEFSTEFYSCLKLVRSRGDGASREQAEREDFAVNHLSELVTEMRVAKASQMTQTEDSDDFPIPMHVIHRSNASSAPASPVATVTTQQQASKQPLPVPVQVPVAISRRPSLMGSVRAIGPRPMGPRPMGAPLPYGQRATTPGPRSNGCNQPAQRLCILPPGVRPANSFAQMPGNARFVSVPTSALHKRPSSLFVIANQPTNQPVNVTNAYSRSTAPNRSNAAAGVSSAGPRSQPVAQPLVHTGPSGQQLNIAMPPPLALNSQKRIQQRRLTCHPGMSSSVSNLTLLRPNIAVQQQHTRRSDPSTCTTSVRSANNAKLPMARPSGRIDGTTATTSSAATVSIPGPSTESKPSPKARAPATRSSSVGKINVRQQQQQAGRQVATSRRGRVPKPIPVTEDEKPEIAPVIAPDNFSVKREPGEDVRF